MERIPAVSPETTTTPPTERTDRAFRPDIEGLRAIAVVLVLFNHAQWALFGGGYVGVDVFFVLSGFLITGLLIREVARTGTISLGQFYARRARRLLPASTLVLLFTVVASYAFLGYARANPIAGDATWSALFAANFRFIEQGTDYLGAQAPPSPLQHYWSLAVEEQFYFVWPILILVVALVGRRVSLRAKLAVVLTGMIAASLAWSIHQTTTDGTTAYFSPFTRASELAIGAMLAVAAPLVLRIPRRLGALMSWAGIATVIASAIVLSKDTPFPGTAMLLPVLGTTLAIAGGTAAPDGGAEVILKRAPFQWIGKLSYSIYLWHWPLLVIAWGHHGGTLPLRTNLLIIAVSIAVSAVSYAVIENPVRSWSFLKDRAPASVAFGLSLVLLSTSVSTWYLNAHREPAPIDLERANVAQFPDSTEVQQAVAEGTRISEWPEQPARIKNPAYEGECDVTRKDTDSAACEFGNPDAERTVVVFGDSHGAMWIPTFDEIGKQADWKVVQLTKPGCPAADFLNYSNSLGRAYEECADYRAWAFGKIAEIDPEVVVITGARKGVLIPDGNGGGTSDGVDRAWAEGLEKTITTIQPHTDRLVILGDIAYSTEPGLDCLTRNPDDVDACNVPIEEAVLADHNAMEARIAAEHGAEYVDLIPYFCTEDTCPAVIGNLTTRRDALHVAENYALWLSEALGEATGLWPEMART